MRKRRQYPKKKELTDEENLMLYHAYIAAGKANRELRIAEGQIDRLEQLNKQRAAAKHEEVIDTSYPSFQEIKRAAKAECAMKEAKLALRFSREIDRLRSNHSSNSTNNVLEQPPEPALSFEQIGSLDQFAQRVECTRNEVIRALKPVGINVFEGIAQEWDAGASLRALSAKHGPTPHTISSWIKSTGRKIEPRNSNPRYDKALMHKLFGEECSTYKIAKKMKVSWETVQRIRLEWEPPPSKKP